MAILLTPSKNTTGNPTRMIRVHTADHSNFMVDEITDCGGAYGAGNDIYIDASYNPTHQRLCVIHEVLELRCRRMRHSDYDKIAIDIIDALMQMGFLKEIDCGRQD